MTVQLRQPTRRLFTVDEYHRMAEAGILTEDDRVELLDGDIVEMTPIGSRHAACVGRLTELLVRRVSGLSMVRIQSPILLGPRSEPQPDVALVSPKADYYGSRHPGPEDVLLLVEVADTSADTDRHVKIPIYAGAGIREVWLVDLTAEMIEAFRVPSPQGYRNIIRAARGERVSPSALPAVSVGVDEVLP